MPRRSQAFRAHRGEGKWALAFLFASFILNIALLLVLSMFEFGGVVQPKKIVAIEQELIEETERSEPLTQRDDTVSLEKVASRQRGRGLTDMADAQGEISVMEVDTPGLQGLGMDLSAQMASTGLSEGWTLPAGKRTRKIKMGKPRQIEDVLDNTAKTILGIIERSKLIVVLLLDESGSLDDDRQIMAAKLEYIFRDLVFAMTDREAKNLSWSVISYGKRHHMLLSPSRRMAHVRRAIVNVRRDITGEENIIGALQFIQSKLGRMASRKLILCLTDEQGSDLEPKKVEAIIGRMKKSKTRFFVLGRESTFDRSSVWEKDPASGLGAYVSRGLSTAKTEIIPANWYYIWTSHDPSGFGSYWLSALAYHTKGRFFILSSKRSPYKPEVLDRYRPEWCLPSTYDKRNKKSKLRAKVLELVSQAYSGMPSTHGYLLYKGSIEDTLPWSKQAARFKAYAQTADNKIKWINKVQKELRSLSSKRMSDKNAKYRWAANYDLLMADLYKLKYSIIQMREIHELAAKRKSKPKPRGRNAEPYIRFDIGHARRSKRTGRVMGKMLGGSEARQAKSRAISAYSKVIGTHRGTPWADRATYSKKYWPILRMSFNSTRYHSSQRWAPKL